MKTSKIHPVRLCLLLILSYWIASFGSGFIFMKEIHVTSPTYGKHTILVDDDDYEYLSKITWSVTKQRNTYYARTNIRVIKNKQRTVRMHRLIIKTPLFVDHKDGNGLNNQKNNLRVCTHAQNVHNSKQRSDSKLRYKGVAKANDGRGHFTWTAWITFNKNRIYLGSFKSDTLAAIAYNDAAKSYFGEFAKLNII